MITNTLKNYILSRIIPARAIVYSSENTIATPVPQNTIFTKYNFGGAVIGEFKNVFADLDNKQSVIQKKGKYLIECTFCSSIDSVGVNIQTCVLINGVVQPNMQVKRYFIGVSYISSATIIGIVSLNKGDTVSIGVKHDKNGTVNITTEFSSLIILKV